MVRDWTDKVAREDTFDMWSAKSSTKVPSLSAILIRQKLLTASLESMQ